MFKRTLAYLFAMGLGAGLMYLAFSYHVVCSDEQILVIPKSPATLADVYADVRGWKASEWKRHGNLSQNLRRAGHAKLIAGAIANDLLEEFTDPILDLRNPEDDSRDDSPIRDSSNRRRDDPTVR